LLRYGQLSCSFISTSLSNILSTHCYEPGIYIVRSLLLAWQLPCSLIATSVTHILSTHCYQPDDYCIIFVYWHCPGSYPVHSLLPAWFTTSPATH
jgi:hypothetical protein